MSKTFIVFNLRVLICLVIMIIYWLRQKMFAEDKLFHTKKLVRQYAFSVKDLGFLNLFKNQK